MKHTAFARVIAFALCAAAATYAYAAGSISGAGATFPYPIYAKWADMYNKETGFRLNYQSIGSGGGIKQIKNKTVTFGASDMPLEPKELTAAGLVQFPTVVGGDVPMVNLDGMKAGRSGPRRADAGQHFPRQDPQVGRSGDQETQPERQTSVSAIVVVHRSDGSGTTFIFTDYLSKVSPDWKSNVGASTAVEWPAGIGAKGNEGVSNNVGQTKGAIGYVEYAYALEN